MNAHDGALARVVVAVTSLVLALGVPGCKRAAHSTDDDRFVELGYADYDAAAAEFRFEQLDPAHLPLSFGLQGGQHVWLMVRVGPVPTAEVSLRITAVRDDVLLGEASLSAAPAELLASPDGTDAVTPALAVILDRAVLADLDRPVRLTAELVWEDGVRSTTEVDAVLVDQPVVTPTPDGVEGYSPIDFLTPDPPRFLVETLTGRPSGCVGLAEVFGDGRLQVVLVGATEVAVLSPADGGAWTETRSDLPAPLSGEVMCDVADFDRDGRLDLVVASGDGGYVLAGDGAGRFSAKAGAFPSMPAIPPSNPFAAGGPRVAGLVAADFDGDGWTDVFVARTVNLGAASLFLDDGCAVDVDGGILCGLPGVEYPGLDNALLRNRRGILEVVPDSGSEGNLQSQCAAAFDFDRDGALDILVCNDGGSSHLFRGDAALGFRDVTEEVGLFDATHGMGVAIADFDGDWALDMYVSDIARASAWRGNANGTFSPAPSLWGFGNADQWAWGVDVADLDNDGDQDLIVVSHATSDADNDWDPTSAELVGALVSEYPDTPLVTAHINSGDGQFVSEDATGQGTSVEGGPRRVAIGDIDGDGLQDAVALFRRRTAPVVLWNRGQAAGGWVTVSGPSPGAMIEVCTPERCQRQPVVAGGSYGAIRPRRVQFGIGDATEATVRVEWPPGVWRDLPPAPSGSLVVVPP
ncbi:MAG: CRTAC1 family protein [Myxococcales bacterium]|nr:CRTAC1 family protein [Myxococcales bacterium]MCB9531465.1 CRTAC1 family protein [Myxococcales bacterium]